MLPNFYILGAQKAGTTWLAAMLRQHPEVFIPKKKELHFYTDNRKYALGPAAYESQFSRARGALAIGEATPNYLAINSPNTPPVIERLKQLTPEARFIVCLRNPVSRAVSAMLHHVRKRGLPPWADFDGFLSELLNSGSDPWGVLSAGLYDVQLDAYFRAFPRERFHILTYEEDVVHRPSESLKTLCGFLDVNEQWAFRAQSRRFNVSLQSRFGLAVAYFLPGGVGAAAGRTLERAGFGRKVQLSAQTIQALEDYYLTTISRVQDLLGREIPRWSSALRGDAAPRIHRTAAVERVGEAGNRVAATSGRLPG